MPEQPSEIQYSSLDVPDVTVRRLREDRIEETASRVLQLIADSYGNQFEPHFVPEGTMAKAYDYSNEERVAGQMARMHLLMSKHDTQYWLAYSGDDEFHLAGLAKVRPQHSFSRRIIDSTSSLLGIDSFARPEVVIDDIIVDPAMQKRRIGSFTMHAALSFGNFDPASQVTLDGFVGNSVNEWFSSLGFVPTNRRGTFAVGAQHTMPQRRYETPQDVSLDDIVQKIERKNPGMGYRSL